MRNFARKIDENRSSNIFASYGLIFARRASNFTPIEVRRMIVTYCRKSGHPAFRIRSAFCEIKMVFCNFLTFTLTSAGKARAIAIAIR